MRELQYLRDVKLREREVIIAGKEQEIQDLLRSHDEAIAAKERENQQLRIQLEQTTQRMDEKEHTIEILQGQLKQMLPSSDQTQLGAKHDSQQYADVTDMKLAWRNGNPALEAMYRECNAAVDKTTIYFNINGDSDTAVYCYNTESDLWTHVQKCYNTCSSFVFIDSTLTSVGGKKSYNIMSEEHSPFSNKLFSLNELGCWVKKFPPMPTERASATAVSTDSSLIVVGGTIHVDRQYKNSVVCPVEVMNISTHQWSVASVVPSYCGLQCASGVVCGDQLYILGATGTKLAYSCSLTDLVQSSRPVSKFEIPDPQILSNIWRRIADLPLLDSTCVSLCGHLLAIGGKKTSDSGDDNKAVYAYNLKTKSWEVTSQTSVARYLCFAVTLPTTNELMVVGGKESFSRGIDSVEFARVII